MLFDPNQTEFNSDCQRKIWKYGTQIVPLEISLADIEDEETRGGCTQIYDCCMEIYTDIYNNSEEYSSSPNEYIFIYLAWLLDGKKSAPLKRDTEAYSRYIERIPRFGFAYDEILNSWANDRYPLFCKYFTRFADLYKKRKQNMGNYVQRLDFRLFAKRIIHTLDDLLRPLPDKERACFSELREYAVTNGMSEKKESAGFFRYVYKNNVSLELRNAPTRISVKFNKFEQFLEAAENQPDSDELVNFIKKNIRLCDGCAANTSSRAKEKEKKKCGYYWVNICETNLLLCINGSIVGNINDIKMLKRMIDIRILEIRRGGY